MAKREWMYCGRCGAWRWHKLTKTPYGLRYVCEECDAAVEVKEEGLADAKSE
jgi:ribosomal protein L44E